MRGEDFVSIVRWLLRITALAVAVAVAFALVWLVQDRDYGMVIVVVFLAAFVVVGAWRA